MSNITQMSNEQRLKRLENAVIGEKMIEIDGVLVKCKVLKSYSNSGVNQVGRFMRYNSKTEHSNRCRAKSG